MTLRYGWSGWFEGEAECSPPEPDKRWLVVHTIDEAGMMGEEELAIIVQRKTPELVDGVYDYSRYSFDSEIAARCQQRAQLIVDALRLFARHYPDLAERLEPLCGACGRFHDEGDCDLDPANVGPTLEPRPCPRITVCKGTQHHVDVLDDKQDIFKCDTCGQMTYVPRPGAYPATEEPDRGRMTLRDGSDYFAEAPDEHDWRL